ncbi:MAG: hypothetical protein K2L94_00885 [Alphaproteobacteria bacterium]|nr:hypothetical protein [Alphaproteobacteria bacterium]
MKHILGFAILSVFLGHAYAVTVTDGFNPGADFQTADEIMMTSIHQTPCASGVFANALARTAATVDENAPEHVIQAWIYSVFQSPDVIADVLKCPELATVADTDTIRFMPVEYTFPGGRHIAINYETQPKILHQRMKIAAKRTLPDANPAPRIGAPGDDAIWTNTDPAWYAILITEHDALADFVGPDKPNTISLRYIEDNIDKIYPSGAGCTSKSVFAGKNDMINLAAKQTVNIDDDDNEYYVAGDVNLQWLSWAEVALDVAITVATVGGGAAVLGATKGVRATRAAKNAMNTVRELQKIDTVQDYVRTTRNLTRASEELAKIDRVRDAAAYTTKADEVRRLGQRARDLEKIDDVHNYRQATASLDAVMAYRRALRSLQIPQRGNVIARAWRTGRALNTGNKTIGRAAKMGRTSMQSGRVRDWLFQSTLRHVGTLAKVESAGGMIYGAFKFAGGMYDWTETSTGDFTNGLEMKPLGLLSADNLDGQENVVNHGMWLMWVGDSTNAADDDAAMLQAMDTAEKFYQDLVQVQSDHNSHACNIDIFIVRPVIRNPGTDDASLYYLIMNDEPWTTAQ